MLIVVRRLLGLFAILLLLGDVSAAWAHTNAVQPNSRVVSGVIVRSAPSAGSKAVGSLLPGAVAEELGRESGWVRVRLADGTIGFVSSRWVITTAAVAPPPAVGGSYLVEAADVGTGLAVLVTGPSFAMLFDGGSNDDLAIGAGNRLVAFIKATHPELRRIDHVILSHPHRDHVELLADVLANYDVGDVWDSGRLNPICGYRRFLEEISRRPTITYHDAIAAGGAHVVEFPTQICYGKHVAAETLSLRRGDMVGSAVVALAPGAAITFLHEDARAWPDVNRNSIVARVDLGARRLLLVGDSPGGERADPSTVPDSDSVEGELLACCVAQLRADILVVGHHGSKTSSRSAFIDAIGATDFIISSGPTKYATVILPDAVIVQELQAKGRVWRTDLDDASCKIAQKVGMDADGEPGGCDNIRVAIAPNGAIVAGYEHPID
jgi:competence protein ComEC